MLRITCPWCGERDYTEFRYGGDAEKERPRPGTVAARGGAPPGTDMAASWFSKVKPRGANCAWICSSPRLTMMMSAPWQMNRAPMAMSLAVTALRVPGVRILDPGCVAKTFPDFFERFAALTAT